MNKLGMGLFASIALHAAILLAASNIPASASVKAPTIVKMKAVDPPKPPPPPPPEPEAPKVETPPPPPPPKALPKPQPKTKEIEAKPRPPEPEAPPPAPPPPPQGFSIDMSNTVQAGGGPAAPAVEGGGNMFADPSDKLPPGKREEQRTPPPSGQGTDPRGTAPSAPETIEEPVPLGSEEERIPPYPQEARDAEVEGQVVLRVLVDATGKVAQVKLQKGLGYGCDQAAMTHAKTWRFKPGTIGGRPVERWITVPITFVLER